MILICYDDEGGIGTGKRKGNDTSILVRGRAIETSYEMHEKSRLLRTPAYFPCLQFP